MHARRFYSQNEGFFSLFGLLKGPSGKIDWPESDIIGKALSVHGVGCFKIFKTARNIIINLRGGTTGRDTILYLPTSDLRLIN